MSLATLEKIHEDLVYIIECLAEDLPGEAKYELSQLKDYLNAHNQILHSDKMLERVEAAIAILIESSRNVGKAACCLAYMRQRIRDELEIQCGRRRIYNADW